MKTPQQTLILHPRAYELAYELVRSINEEKTAVRVTLEPDPDGIVITVDAITSKDRPGPDQPRPTELRRYLATRS